MFASAGRELEVGVGREMEELGFSPTRFRTVSMFSSIIFVSGRTWKLGRGDVTVGQKSIDNSREGVTVRKLPCVAIRSACGIPFLKQLDLQSKCWCENI